MKFKAQNEGGGGSGLPFLKLKDKESVRGVFRGEPVDYRQHWVGGKGQVCTGAGCKSCEQGNRSGFRFRLNFIVNENGAFVSKVWEQGWTVYEQLSALGEDYNLEEHTIKITRNGSGKDDTTYSVVPVPNGALSKEQLQQVSTVKLHDLDVAPSGHDAFCPSDTPF